jgi:hypothetical protein
MSFLFDDFFYIFRQSRVVAFNAGRTESFEKLEYILELRKNIGQTPRGDPVIMLVYA